MQHIENVPGGVNGLKRAKDIIAPTPSRRKKWTDQEKDAFFKALESAGSAPSDWDDFSRKYMPSRTGDQLEKYYTKVVVLGALQSDLPRRKTRSQGPVPDLIFEPMRVKEPSEQGESDTMDGLVPAFGTSLDSAVPPVFEAIPEELVDKMSVDSVSTTASEPCSQLDELRIKAETFLSSVASVASPPPGEPLVVTSPLAGLSRRSTRTFLRKRKRVEASSAESSDVDVEFDPDATPPPRPKRRHLLPKAEPKGEIDVATPEAEPLQPAPKLEPYHDGQGVAILASVADAPGPGALFLGNEEVATNRVWLVSNSVSLIVNAAQEVKNFYPDDFQYEKLELSDTNFSKILPEFPRISKIIHDSRLTGKSVLIHCKLGQSRSVAFTVAYLLEYQGFTLKKCVDHFKHLEIITNLNIGFQAQLMSLEKSLKGTNSINLLAPTDRTRQKPEMMRLQTTIDDLFWKQKWNKAKKNQYSKKKTQRKPKTKLLPQVKGQMTLEAAYYAMNHDNAVLPPEPQQQQPPEPLPEPPDPAVEPTPAVPSPPPLLDTLLL